MVKDDVLAWIYQRDNTANRLTDRGFAQIRTGEYRSLAKAKKMAKEAAEVAGVEVKTSDKGSYLLVTVK